MGNTTQAAVAVQPPSELLHGDNNNDNNTPKENNKEENHEDKSYYPEFSWDTLPLYIHVHKVSSYTPTELQYLSTFPLITLEKTTAMRIYQYTDVGTIETAAQIKKLNANCKVLFYWNSLIHYAPMYSFDDELDDDGGDGKDGKEDDCSLFLKDKDTNKEIKILKGGYKLYDLSLAKIQDWWISKAKHVVCKKRDDDLPSPIDGIFIDANAKVLHPNFLTGVANVSLEKKKKVVQGWKNIMSSLQTQLNDHQKIKIANLIRARLPHAGLDSLHYFDGSYIEHFESAGLWSTKDTVEYVAKSIEAVQEAARSEKIIALTLNVAEWLDKDEYDKMHIDNNDEDDDDGAFIKKLQPRIDYCIGLYLIIAERYSYLCIHDGYDVNTYAKNKKCKSIMWLKRLAEYDYPLGKPCSPAEKNGFVYSREFEHVKVEVNIETRRAKLDWRDDWVMVSKE